MKKLKKNAKEKKTEKWKKMNARDKNKIKKNENEKVISINEKQNTSEGKEWKWRMKNKK